MRFNNESQIIEMTEEEKSFILEKIKDISADPDFVYPSVADVEANFLPNLDNEKIIWYAFFLTERFSILKLTRIEQRNAFKLLKQTLNDKIKIVKISDLFPSAVGNGEQEVNAVE